jgi:glycine dehydrogenase subunit 2
MSEKKLIKDGYHAARWLEPVIFELGRPGERGIYPPAAEKEIKDSVGDVLAKIPAKVRRKELPKLPELAQPQVLRHFLRLSQETMGMDFTPDISEGTCTMKHSPKVNEQLARHPKFTELHPLQDEETTQGILELMAKFGEFICEISGLDAYSYQPGGGAQGVFTNACIMRAYHESRGEGEQRNEVITTIFSHPVDSATPAVAGYKLIVLYPDENGYPDLDALKAAISPHTAGMFITNPEDTGIYNPRIKEYTDAIHSVGGLCAYDQANLNGIMGIARAKEAGFDMCHFNLHKTFSSPHGCMGPGCGAVMVREELAKFLPTPVIGSKDGKFFLDCDRPDSLGKVRGFYGPLGVVVRSYAWTMMHGADGLLAAAQTAVLNNNYLAKKLENTRGLSYPYAEGKRRLDQIRWSWEQLNKDTGVGTEDIDRRIVDYGMQWYHPSHDPWIVAEPMTLEPTETYSKDDIDEYVQVIQRISDESYANPELVKNAPYNSSSSLIDESVLHSYDELALTWRAWLKKKAK